MKRWHLELNLNKIYTYAFDLRPHLYLAVENAGFFREATLLNHVKFKEKYIDVVIHSKINTNKTIDAMIVQILIDNKNSWIIPFALELEKILIDKFKYKVYIKHDSDEIKKVMFLFCWAVKKIHKIKL